MSRYTFRGTNTADFVAPMPLPATGKQVTMTGIAIARLAGGKVVEVLDMGDNLGLLGSALRKEPRSRKVDKCGAVLSRVMSLCELGE